MFSVGEISLIAVLAFVLGRIWSTSEAIYQARQNAYLDALKALRDPRELKWDINKIELSEEIEKFRSTGPSIYLFGSPEVIELFDSYGHEIGWLIGFLESGGERDDDFHRKVDGAVDILQSMTTQMRRDSLSWSVFLLRDIIAGKQRKTAKAEEK